MATEAPGEPEDRFRRLLDTVTDYAIFMTDAHGRIRTWNAGAERMSGYRAEEVLGRDVSLLYEPEEAALGQPARERAVTAAEGRFEGDVIRARKRGDRFRAHVVMTPQRDEDGGVVGYAAVMRDVSARRETMDTLRRSEERFRLMVEAVQDYAIFMLDPDGFITTWNVGAERIKGYDRDEILGKHFSIFYTDEDRQRNHPAEELARATAEGRYAEEGWRVRKDGSLFWASVVITALRDPNGVLVGFAKVTRDLTDQRRREQLLEALEARDEFVAVASHELRTPLSALQLLLESLRETVSEMPSSKIASEVGHRVERALHSTGRLRRLVDALLDVSRIAVGQFELDRQPVDLRDVVRRTTEEMRPEAAKVGCDLVLDLPDEPVAGTFDRTRVDQMLFNLVANAIKFGRGAPIEVRFRSRADFVTFSVRDHGQGISPEDQQRIFQRFERKEAVVGADGLGLGLYVTKRIAEAHGGTVSASSSDGGTTFVVELPRSSADPHARS